MPFAVAVSLAVAACGGGGGGGNSKDATSLIDTAFKHSIKSANIALDLQAQLNGVSSLKGPLELKVTGPYQSNGSGKLPDFDLSASILGGGQSLPLAVRSTGDDLFIQLRGTWYELGKQAVAQLNQQLQQSAKNNPHKSLSALGVSPLTWLRGAKNVGDTTIGGTRVSHVSAVLDVGKLLDDLNRVVAKASVAGSAKPPQLSASQKAEIQKIVKDPHLEVYVSKSDQTLKRLATTIQFSVPKDQQSKLKGLSGGTVQFSIEFSNIGQQTQISAPSGAQSLSSLTGALGGLGGSSSSGGGSSTPSTPGGPTSKQFQDYAKCIQKAGGSNAGALQKCAAILSK